MPKGKGADMRLSQGLQHSSARKAAWAFCAALPLLSAGCESSNGDLAPAPELATTAAGNCIGAPAPEGTWPGDEISYSNNRVFLESQGWWGEDDGSIPRYGDAEHIHVGMCFPLQDTVSGQKTMRVLVRGHNLPVGSVIKSTALHDAGQDAAGQPPFKTITWNRTVTAADNNDVILWQDVLVNTAAVPSGRREFRNLTIAVRPPESGQAVGAELHVSSGWCWITSNGGATGHSGGCETNPLTTVGRGWYDCFEYKLAETRDWTYPYGGIPRNANYTVKIAAYDGAGPDTHMTGYEVRLDPNFHAGVKGFRVDSAGGSAFGKSVTIPAAQLTGPGVHKLVVISFANATCTATGPNGGIVPQDGEVSGVLVVPIRVN
jgi:hypothetical protein